MILLYTANVFICLIFIIILNPESSATKCDVKFEVVANWEHILVSL